MNSFFTILGTALGWFLMVVCFPFAWFYARVFRSPKSFLMVHPQYQYSFIMKREFEKRGWTANIHVASWLPEKLVFNWEHVFYFKRPRFVILRRPKYYLQMLWYGMAHKYIYFHGPPEILDMRLDWLKPILPKGFRFELALYKLLHCKLIYVPSGCFDTETKENFSKLDGGNVCANCGFSEGVCDDNRNKEKFNIIRRYMDMNVHGGSFLSSQYNQTFFRYKSQDFNLWNPNIDVPEAFKLPATNKLRVLHGFQSHHGEREVGGKNIKGSPYIIKAVQQLEAEGYPVEMIYLTGVHQKDMRFYQVQADIIVEQLIIGWWGSTGIETMSLGKPVICYLRPSWKDHFFKIYPQYNSLPIIEANTETIYEVLKKVVEDKSYREQKAKESFEFAQRHFNPEVNVPEFIRKLEAL